MKRSVMIVAGWTACVSFGGPVEFKEDAIVLPTYAPGGYDKTPLFYTGRVYQGAQGRVYPYPMQDILHDEKVDETYKYLTLANDWLEMGILPEHGGHLLNLTDRQTGFETFYRQHIAELKQGIAELESPVPTVISAYAKFGGENTPMERAEKAREHASALRVLLKEIDN